MPKKRIQLRKIYLKRDFVKNKQYYLDFQISTALWVRQETGRREKHCEGS